MKCPVCGAKMIDGKICKYCNTTNEQVELASNKAVKIARREKRFDDICYTNVIPSDVNKTKLILYTIFLGLFGVGNFYVNKLYKGIYCVVSYAFALIFSILRLCVENGILNNSLFITYGFSFSSLLMAVNMLMWGFDCIGFIFKSYKVPVVLPKEEVKVNHHSIK